MWEYQTSNIMVIVLYWREFLREKDLLSAHEFKLSLSGKENKNTEQDKNKKQCENLSDILVFSDHCTRCSLFKSIVIIIHVPLFESV